MPNSDETPDDKPSAPLPRDCFIPKPPGKNDRPTLEYYWTARAGTTIESIVIYVDMFDSTRQREIVQGDGDCPGYDALNSYTQHFLGHNAKVYQIFVEHFSNSKHTARIAGFVGDSVMIILNYDAEAFNTSLDFAAAVVSRMQDDRQPTSVTIACGEAAQLDLVSNHAGQGVVGQTTVGRAVDLAVRLSWNANPYNILVGSFREQPVPDGGPWCLKPGPPGLKLTLDKWPCSSSAETTNANNHRFLIYVAERSNKYVAERSNKDQASSSTYPLNSRAIETYILRVRTLSSHYQGLVYEDDKGTNTFTATVAQLMSRQMRDKAIPTDSLLGRIVPIHELCKSPLPAELLSESHPAFTGDATISGTIKHFHECRDEANSVLKGAREELERIQKGGRISEKTSSHLLELTRKIGELDCAVDDLTRLLDHTTAQMLASDV